MIPIDKIEDLPDEEWRPVVGYDKYLVSSLGRIKSLKHKKPQLLKAFPNNKGYYRVCLSNGGSSKHFLVSRLVAAAFCENDDPQNKTTVDHIDGDITNNRADNLRFMSLRDNYRAYKERMKKNMMQEYKYKSSILDQLRERPIPYYNHFLFLQGYTPAEILQAEDSPQDRFILEQHQHRRNNQ